MKLFSKYLIVVFIIGCSESLNYASTLMKENGTNSSTFKDRNRTSRFMNNGNYEKEKDKQKYKNSGNLLKTNIDQKAVLEGMFKPDNIAIHVGQNAFNFLASSIAWAIAGMVYATQSQARSSVNRKFPSGSYFGGGENDFSSASQFYATGPATLAAVADLPEIPSLHDSSGNSVSLTSMTPSLFGRPISRRWGEAVTTTRKNMENEKDYFVKLLKIIGVSPKSIMRLADNIVNVNRRRTGSEARKIWKHGKSNKLKSFKHSRNLSKPIYRKVKKLVKKSIPHLTFQ